MSWDVLDGFGGERAVAVRPTAIRKLGPAGGILLCQFIYWQKRTKNEDGWFYPTQAKLEEETGLSENYQQTARKHMSARGFLEEKRMGIPGQLHYRLDLALLTRFLLDQQPTSNESSIVAPTNLVRPQATNLSKGIIQESTKEIIENISTKVVNPQSQAPTLQDSLDESVGSHQRIGDSLVKTLGEDPEIEIEMADEEEIFNESPDAKAIRKGAAKKSKPKTSSWNTSAPKNKSSLETPTPQGNNSSPHSARPPSDAWLEALTPSQRLVAENVGERGWDRSLKLLPSRLKDYANVDMALMEQLLDQAKLATVGKEPQFRANTIVQELDRLLLASRVKTGSSHGWTSWHITTTALGRKQWTRSLVNPITQMNEYQTADYDADSPDGGKPKEQA